MPVSADAAISDVMALRPIAYEMKEQPRPAHWFRRPAGALG